MITLFTICAPFTEKKIIQENAIKSWMKLRPKPEIFIMGGKEKGVKEFAEENNIRIIECKTNEDGIPYTKSMFQKAKEEAKNDILCFINSDIILYQNFIDGINLINEKNLDEYLAVGQRHDVDIDYEINDEMLSNFYILASKGKIHGDGATDYFIYPKKIDFSHMPEFDSVRPGWDTWLCIDIKKRKIPLIDCTNVIKIIHQNHRRQWAEETKENDAKNKMNILLAGLGYWIGQYKGLKKESTHVLMIKHTSDKIMEKRQFNNDAWAYQDIKNMIDKEDPVIIDGGACVGDTIDIFKQAFPDSIIYAFEPVMGQNINGRNLLDIKKGNRLAKKWTNIKVLPHAIGEKSEFKKIYVTSNFENSSLLKPLNKVIRKTAEIYVLSLDKWADDNDIKNIEVVKLDIQGNELNALKGMKKLLIHSIKAILLEISFKQEYEGQPNFYEIGYFLERFGFKLFQLYETDYKQTNALFIKDI